VAFLNKKENSQSEKVFDPCFLSGFMPDNCRLQRQSGSE
jgi:hypothetical protein